MKAMLEIKNMPDSCYDCPCCSIDKQCKAKEHKDIPDVFRGRPGWCPLIVGEGGAVGGGPVLPGHAMPVPDTGIERERLSCI